MTLDAHKWLGVQKSCSAVLLREEGALRAAYGHDERYMLHEGDQANPVDRTLEYSRPLRSLRLWLALRVHGAAQYREWIAHTLRLASRLADQIRASDDFELLHEPQLSTLCFRHVPADTSPSPRPSSATAASSSPPRWSTTSPACASPSSTSAPPRSRSTRCCRSPARWLRASESRPGGHPGGGSG